MTNSNNCFSFTLTPKGKNEDAHATFENESFLGVIIADGVGSYSKADEASKRAVELFKSRIIKFSEDTVEEGIYKTFDEIEEHLKQLGEETNATDAYATTLLVAIQLSSKILIAYLGNGAAFHIRQNMSQCKTNNLLSWATTNYLVPHTTKNRDGKEALYRFLSSDKNHRDFTKSKPTVIAINREFNNSILLLATDGFYSKDQVTIGKISKTGETITVYDKKYIEVLSLIEKFFNKQESSLKDELEKYFHEIKESLDDDTTIGVLIDNG